MKKSLLTNFQWPSIPELNHIPKWDKGKFLINGEEHGSLISYNNLESNWSNELTELHEMEAGDGLHPIDIASRNLASKSFEEFGKDKRKLILEVGCSSGYMLRDLQKKFPHFDLVGSDYLSAPLEKISQKLHNIPLIQFDLQNCPFPENSFDGIIALNVLEHIKKDEKALKNLYRIVKPNSFVHIEVPANPNLFCIYDEHLMHHRRYGLNEILEKIKAAGFKVKIITHLGFLIFPIFWIRKKMNRQHFLKTEEEKLEIVSKQINQTNNSVLMKLIFQLESKLGEFFNFPYGIRIVIKCQK